MSLGQVTTLRVGSFGVAIPGDGIVVSEKFLRKPEDIDLNCRMVSAVSEAWIEAGKNPQQAATALVALDPRVEKGDVEVVKESWLRAYSLTQLRPRLNKPMGFIFDEDWERLATLAKEHKLTDKIRPKMIYYFSRDYEKCMRSIAPAS